MEHRDSGAGRGSRQRRGFTLVELLVVMLIIGLVISIVLPALGGARNAARNAATQALCKDLAGAIDLFATDHSSNLPGYFDAATMGRTENGTRGFTQLENMMVDLGGGEVTAPGAGILTVGPTATTTVYIDLDKFGADVPGNNVYFAPKGKNLVAQDGTEFGLQAGGTDEQLFPDVVDAFGNPLLVWVENETALGPIETADDFARANSGATGNLVSRFYWNSNAGFLSTSRLGKSGKNQAFVGAGGSHSLLGSGLSDTILQSSMMGLLGNASFRQGTTLTAPDILPNASRGRFVIQSAGADGVYLGAKDKKARQYTDSNGALLYGFNWVNSSNQPHADRNGQPTSIDIIKDFDDIVMTGSN